MAIYFENIELVATRLALLGLVVIIGVPGNVISVYINVKSFKRCSLNGIAYLHLAVVDLGVCFLHSSLGIVLESVGYYSLNNDMGSWAPLLKFLARDFGVRLYFSASFISLNSLTFVAVLRTWRVFFPFGQARKTILMCTILLLDLAVICFACLLNMPQRYLLKPQGLNKNQTDNATDILDSQNGTQWLPQWSQNTTIVTQGELDHEGENVARGVTRVATLNLSATVILWSRVTEVIVIALAYILICVKISVVNRKMAGKENIQKKLFFNRQLKHLMTHFILFSIMALTFVSSLISSAVPGKSEALRRLFTTFAALNSAINPYIYCILIPAYRKEVNRLLCCKQVQSTSTKTGQSQESCAKTPSSDIISTGITSAERDQPRGSCEAQVTNNTANDETIGTGKTANLKTGGND